MITITAISIVDRRSLRRIIVRLDIRCINVPHRLHIIILCRFIRLRIRGIGFILLLFRGGLLPWWELPYRPRVRALKGPLT